MKTTPYNVSITLSSLKNPQDKINTESFYIQTFTTTNGYAIDELKANLSVNFICKYPCKACEQSTPTRCLECYSTVAEKWWMSSYCIATCPETYYGDLTNNTC